MKNQENDKKKQWITGLANILIGGILIVFSLYMRGSDLNDFITGVMLGAGCGDMLVGVYVIARYVIRK